MVYFCHYHGVLIANSEYKVDVSVTSSLFFVLTFLLVGGWGSVFAICAAGLRLRKCERER